MSVQELRAETQRRGLGTARARADLIQRLTDHDNAQGSAEADSAETPPESATDEAAPPAEVAAPASLRSFRYAFQAEAGGPDEETHLANRQTTVQAAIDAGLTPRGDARLAATTDGQWVYEVAVRKVT